MSAWIALSLRIQWSGYEDQSPDLRLTVTDERGTILLTLLGGVMTPFMRISHPKRTTLPPYYADARTVHRGTGRRRTETKVWFIADGSSNELYIREQGSWKRVGSGQAEADALPAALRVLHAGSLIQVFTDDASASAEDESPPRIAIQEPDDTTTLAQREASALDNLIATVAVRGVRPRKDDGKEDMCGAKVYSMKVKPSLLTSTDASTRKLLLAMCTDPFWTRGDLCVGYSALKSGGGGAM